MLGKNRFNKHYSSLDSTERNKAFILLLILLAIFIFCIFFSISDFLSGHLWDNPGFFMIGAVSPIMILLLLKGYYRITVPAVLFVFTFILSFSQIVGEFREVEILGFVLIISFASIYGGRRYSIPITIYCVVYLTVLYFLKRDLQTFSQAYLPYSLFFVILISAVNILNSWILERNLSQVSEEVQKRTRELNASKEYAELIFHHNPSAAYTVDQSGRILDFNMKAEELTGYEKKELVGVNETILVPRVEQSLSEYHFDKSGESVGTLISKEGKERTVARYSALLTNEKGEITGKIVSFTDLTEWREFERYKTDLERVIRHDLKTPLNSVIGFPAIMLADKNLSEEYREYLNIIRNSGLSMKKLIEASRYLYKIEEGTWQPNPENTDIIALLRQIEADLTELRSQKKVKVRILIDGKRAERNDSLIIISEKILIQMVLSNLIKNAIEASPSDSDVTIEISRLPGLAISVHNKGVIPEEIKERFFEKYVTMNKKSGTGLGTYSARLMSRAIGADLTFTSNEQEGTVLNLSFSS
ncbi:sensor histidine kinase [Spirochaeta isovalerica]|uniref:histidine kinase n=1 Tax=Spirochaeta isovalerica TaxID=150 RepID=A0A841REX1_9SPIO|nr:PAS domain-containing sensor histidine kinase [Spirochaeta isovalerica]MBB6481757.1 PAS domain S-box-containing protein [Spirochaeta isovalerica]